MFCNQCGAQIGDAARFCPGCGRAVARADETRTSEGEQSRMSAAAPPASPMVTPPPGLAPTEPIATVVSPTPTTAPVAHPVPPAPTVLAPAAYAPASQPQPPTRRSHVGLWIALAIGVLVVLTGAVVALYFTGVLAPIGIGPKSTVISSTEANDSASEGAKDGAGDAGADSSDDAAATTGTSGQELSEAETYELLAEEYEKLWTLHAQIGLANADGTYGGTGFAYDVFNPNIGSPDRATRVTLVTGCQELADSVTTARSVLASARIDAGYAAQRSELLSLYDMLNTRAQAMLGAAQIAVDSPDEASWRSTLSPASVDSRKEFEAAYPSLKPTP